METFRSASSLDASLLQMKETLEKRGMNVTVFGAVDTVVIKGFNPVDNCLAGDITFATSEEFLDRALQGQCAAVVTSHKVFDGLQKKKSIAQEQMQKPMLVVPDAALAHAWLKQEYADWDFRDEEEWGRKHPSAVIHAEAHVDDSVVIGPNVVVGKGAVVAAGVVLLAGVIVERGATIGEKTILHPGVIIGRNCSIGRRCIIRSGTIIGSEGMGFAQDASRHHHRIPQTGIVVIEDDCVLGAGNCIDRAMYGKTWVRRGTIMDNACHLAHNVELGEDCIILAGTIIAGSTKLGNRVICSGMTGILDHLTIADDTIFVMRADVPEDVPKGGMYAGSPLLPVTAHHRLTHTLRNLPQTVKELKALEKRLASLEAEKKNPEG